MTKKFINTSNMLALGILLMSLFVIRIAFIIEVGFIFQLWAVVGGILGAFAEGVYLYQRIWK